MNRILITGSCGLIGSALRHRLAAAGCEVASFDIAEHNDGIRMDVADYTSIATAMGGCSGIVHLAAVSRVIWGEQDPVRCHEVNVQGTRNVLGAAACRGLRAPWVLVASSREVYGQADDFPVPESAPFRPMNVYAKSKVEAEGLVSLGRDEGLNVSVIRFSSVYGAVMDHTDRVAPAFARQASRGGVLRVDGQDTTLDFTHVKDVVAALHVAIESLEAGDGPLPPLHLASGRGTTLQQLAAIAIKAAGGGSIELRPPRGYDVRSFVGNPDRAEQILGWRTSTILEDGIDHLIECYRSTKNPLCGAEVPS
jgi:UDP-glucose 4-epimerase